MADKTVQWISETTGTWAGIQRSTEPMWRPVPIRTSAALPSNVWYVLNGSSFTFHSWDDLPTVPVDPNMQLPEGF